MYTDVHGGIKSILGRQCRLLSMVDRRVVVRISLNVCVKKIPKDTPISRDFNSVLIFGLWLTHCISYDDDGRNTKMIDDDDNSVCISFRMVGFRN